MLFGNATIPSMRTGKTPKTQISSPLRTASPLGCLTSVRTTLVRMRAASLVGGRLRGLVTEDVTGACLLSDRSLLGYSGTVARRTVM